MDGTNRPFSFGLLLRMDFAVTKSMRRKSREITMHVSALSGRMVLRIFFICNAV